MIIFLNPVRILIVSADERKGLPFEMYIGDPKRITSYKYQESTNRLYIEVDGKDYEVYQPDFYEFINLFHHLKQETIKNRVSRFMRNFMSSGKRSLHKYSPRTYEQKKPIKHRKTR
jgi:hypothetical protein